MTNFLKSKQEDFVEGRQIAFVSAFLLPAGKLLEAPSILSKYAAGDLLLPAFLHFLLQGSALLGILFVLSGSEKTLLERLEEKLGKGIYVLYILYAIYFLFAAILPIFDMEKYIYAAFFDTSPTTFTFAFFFLLSAFLCVKNTQSIGRSADLCLFLFLIPFLSLVVMAFSASDLSGILPIFSEKFSHTMSAMKHTFPHFSDLALLLPLLLNYKMKKGDGLKIMSGYAVGGFFTLLFLALFFGIYSSLAQSQHYAFSKIGQYFPAVSVLGRIDFIFVYCLTIVLLFYTCLPLQYSTNFFSLSIKLDKKIPSLVINLAFFLFVFFGNKHYNSIYKPISGNLSFIFWGVGLLLPLACLLLPRDKKRRNK